MEQRLNTTTFLTEIQLNPVGPFGSTILASMRSIKRSKLSEAFRSSAHGVPIHIGDPARIGVKDITLPSAGDSCTVEEDEVAVFWACGSSVSRILSSAGEYIDPFACDLKLLVYRWRIKTSMVHFVNAIGTI